MAVISWFMKRGLLARVGILALAAVIVGAAFANGAASYKPASVSVPNSFADVPSSTPSAVPVVTTDEVRSTTAVPFAQATVQDAAVASGLTSITTAGVAGTREVVYSVTYTDGVESSRRVVSDSIIVAPVDEVTTVGTYIAPPPPPPPVAAAPTCDGNYSGACVPIASDVDCAGGSGNGPAYVTGPVRIVGSDIYDLDRDGDGIACD